MSILNSFRTFAVCARGSFDAIVSTQMLRLRKHEQTHKSSRLLLAPLVFVDCQFGLEEGKMKGSTEPRRMDEPFYS